MSDLTSAASVLAAALAVGLAAIGPVSARAPQPVRLWKASPASLKLKPRSAAPCCCPWLSWKLTIYGLVVALVLLFANPFAG